MQMVSALQDSGVWIMSTSDISGNMYQSNISTAAKPLPVIESTIVDKVAFLERQLTVVFAMVTRLSEQIESLKGQQTLSIADTKCTLDELTDAVADKLNTKANLW